MGLSGAIKPPNFSDIHVEAIELIPRLLARKTNGANLMPNDRKLLHSHFRARAVEGSPIPFATISTRHGNFCRLRILDSLRKLLH
jgi:hypothetical protein